VRLLPLIPVLLVTVLLAAVLTVDDGAVATLKQNAAGIPGNATLLSLAAIRPVTRRSGPGLAAAMHHRRLARPRHPATAQPRLSCRRPLTSRCPP
jgi:hypothetical protein